MAAPTNNDFEILSSVPEEGLGVVLPEDLLEAGPDVGSGAVTDAEQERDAGTGGHRNGSGSGSVCMIANGGVSSVIPLVMDEVVDRDVVGKYTGQVKWFNDKLGYGFITVCDGRDKGKDIFVHHTGIRPVNSNYKTLRKGEYVNFNLTNGHNGPQAVDVTGICGGSLMCDVLPMRRSTVPLASELDMGMGAQHATLQCYIGGSDARTWVNV
jgi:CspA family cold shock protein